MSEYLMGSCCNSCSKLGDATAPTPVVTFVTILELGLAAFGVYSLINSKVVSKTLGMATSRISRKSRKNRRRRR